MARKKNSKIKRKNKTKGFAYLILICLSVLFAIFLAFKLYLYSLPPINNFDSIKPNPVTSIYSSDGKLLKTFSSFKFEKVEIEDVPDDLKNAFIATEDKNFYHHEGYDLLGLVRSTIVNIMAGRAKQGASTITQQLARILFLSNEKTFDRKIRELILAHRIEKTISKNEILEMYLNAVYLGSGTYGVLSASKTYFDKELKDLTLAEKALIAGLPQAPSIYSPFKNPDKAIKRRNWVLKRMRSTGCITKKQYEQAIQEELTLNQKPRIYSHNKAPYLVDYIINELKKIGFDEDEISSEGLRIYSTVDYESQIKAQDSIRTTMQAVGLTKDKSQASLFSFNPTNGKIYAYVGGKNYEKSQYDRVTNAIRPPGSSFKPFVYAAALKKGLTTQDLMDDSPLKVSEKWAPKNYGDKYRGEIPAWLALAVSSNVCAVRLIQATGVDAVISMARDLGITTPLQRDYTIALGSNGVKLYDMVISYGAFANGGYRVQPYAVERVENSRGVVIYENKSVRSLKVLDFDIAASMTYMLKKVISSGTGKTASIGREAAGKTGTTDDYRDAWFVGYTPDLVTGVWVGNDDNTKMPGITGSSAPARIWREYMKVATSNFPESVFNYPEEKTAQNEEKLENAIEKEEIVEEVTENTEEEKPKYEIMHTSAPAPVPNTEEVKQIEFKKPFDTNATPASAPLPGQ
ncbi:MAG: PBP1A family penicillin-binding protein [Cyanobacteria bacterium SIG30]|nr:PBP1A family penicillin-binding protein [Cyanobacteria bacterium SIG30]